MPIQELYGENVLEIMRYDLNYNISGVSGKLTPNWIRYERKYNLTDIEEPSIISPDNISFFSKDLGTIYPENLIDYLYFEKIVNYGKYDSNGNFEFIELAISKKTISLCISLQFIKSPNTRRTVVGW